jgi:GNAT superfamily N-acetyltransferase
MANATKPVTDGVITIVPASEASWDDLQAVFGKRGMAANCQCQWFRYRTAQFNAASAAERAGWFREQTACGQPGAATSGLVAYLDGEPAGWCAVEPRPAYERLLTSRVVWPGRDEDRADDGVWAVTCFVTRAGFRRRGVSAALARSSVDHARQRGARALEGYPMLTEPGEEVPWGALYIGSRGIFAAAGFAEVSRPTPRRVVMRIDF